jgi:hypothetical protein
VSKKRSPARTTGAGSGGLYTGLSADLQRCHHDHRHAVRIMASMGDIDIAASIEYFAAAGGL